MPPAQTGRSSVLLLLIVCAPLVSFDARASSQTCGKGIILDAAVDDHACTRLNDLMDSLDQQPGEKIHTLGQGATVAAGKIRALLVSEGYYAAEARPKILADGASSPGFTVRPGKRFRITDHAVIYVRYKAEPLPRSLKAFGLEASSSPRGDDLVAIQKSILTYLRNTGRPLAELSERKVLAHFETQEARVLFEIDPGPPCRYGPLQIQGLTRLRPEFVTSSVRLPEGKACSRVEMDEQRLKLARTGLFASAEIRPIFASDPAGPDPQPTPVAVNLKEAKARTVGAGLSYATNRGAGGRVYWEHRNLLGQAERLHVELDIEEIRQQGTLSLRKPLPARNAALFAELGMATEALEAYDANRYTLKAGTDFPLWGPWRLATSAEYEFADVEDLDTREKGHSISVPVVLSQSTVSDALDPKDGIVLTLTAAPTYTTFGDGTAFVQLDGRLSHHRPLTKDQKYRLSTWGHIGSLQGGKASDIPATRLYYGGGAKSVRAIAWEHLGALDAAGIPFGGRSILDGGVELRADVTKTWQVVGFVEGGRVFEAPTPDFEEDILWGGGFGLRYHTPIGPLRLDLAVPFDPRHGDDEYQVYIGLGQAF